MASCHPIRHLGPGLDLVLLALSSAGRPTPDRFVPLDLNWISRSIPFVPIELNRIARSIPARSAPAARNSLERPTLVRFVPIAIVLTALLAYCRLALIALAPLADFHLALTEVGPSEMLVDCRFVLIAAEPFAPLADCRNGRIVPTAVGSFAQLEDCHFVLSATDQTG